MKTLLAFVIFISFTANFALGQMDIGTLELNTSGLKNSIYFGILKPVNQPNKKSIILKNTFALKPKP